MTAFTIARLTFTDLTRRRVSLVAFFVAIFLIFASFVIKDLTIGQWRRVIIDIGLAASDLSVTLLAITLGASLVAGDVDRRTIFPLLAKAIDRTSLVLGRLGGLCATLLLCSALTGFTVSLTLLAARQQGFETALLQNVLTIGSGATMLGSLAILFSTFTTSTLAGMSTAAMAIAGHFCGQLDLWASKTTMPLRVALRGLRLILPDLESLDLKSFIAHEQTVAGILVGQRVVYAACYALTCAFIGALCFSKRDIG